MATPANKHPKIVEFLNQTTKSAFGRTRTESIENDICVVCGQPANEFRDELSKKEYTISGMCQECQNSVFDAPDDNDNDNDELESGDWQGLDHNIEDYGDGR